MKKRYNTSNNYYRRIFGEKIFKVPIDANSDCPDRNGTIAHSGCMFCTVSGSGDATVTPGAPIRDQFYEEIDFTYRKWPNVRKYLVYFQNFTDTHDTVGVTRERYEQAIDKPGMVGIDIGIRPNCLPDEMIAYITEPSDRMHVAIEFGLQTTCDETSKIINRARTYDLYVETVKCLYQLAPRVEIVPRLTNGLPDETHNMMIENVRRRVTDSEIDGIKLHLLHLMTSTRMQRDYHKERLKLLGMEEYVNIICDQLEIIPRNIIIHRIMSDALRNMLTGPVWNLKKWEVLNAIDKEVKRRDSYQGCKLEDKEVVL